MSKQADSPAHPIQPLVTDSQGVLRFKGNAIVRYLLDTGGSDMNKLAATPFSQEDREQFAQLIGYSLSGFSELSYVRDTTYAAAAAMAKGQKETTARIKTLEATLQKVRKAAKALATAVFRIHPDDLKE